MAAACLPLTPVFAQPPTWPLINQPLTIDPAEPGCADHRDVTAAYYATDATYFYFRLVTVTDAGWPGTNGSPSEARYKWWFDTGGTAATISGTSVSNAEYLIAVEDQTSNANDPNGPRDQLGEMTLMDDLANAGISARWASHSHYLTNAPDTSPSPSTLWRRTLGSGTAGVGGPQQAMGNADIGYRVTGNNVDIYVSRAAVGNPANPCVIWASDTQSTNLDQAPDCDRPIASTCLNVASPTATPTSTPSRTSSSTATGTATRTPTQTASPTATATAVNAATATASPTFTSTPSPSATSTAVDTATATATPSPTETSTAGDTQTTTASPTPTPTETATETAEPTATETDTPEATATATDTPEATPTDTAEATVTDTPEPTATDTSMPVATATASPTETGTVVAAETVTNTPSPSPTPTIGFVQCSFTPRGTCRTPGKSLLILQDKSPDRRDLVKWKWRKGAATSMTNPAEFGDPVHTAAYSLCIYHGGVLLEELHVPAGGTCGSKPCWKPLRNHLQPPPSILRAYKYRDKKRLTNGVLKVILRGGAEGKATVIFKGSGANLPDPGLGLNEPVAVELINSETTVCWGDTYGAPLIKRNDAKKFKAKRK
jgi:hypothetical protein